MTELKTVYDDSYVIYEDKNYVNYPPLNDLAVCLKWGL